MSIYDKLSESEIAELTEILRNTFEPKTELAHKLPDISEVADNTSVAYIDNGKTVVKKALDGKYIEIYRES